MPSERTLFIAQCSAVLAALVVLIVGLTVGLRTPPPPNGGSPPDRSHLFLNKTTISPATTTKQTTQTSTPASSSAPSTQPPPRSPFGAFKSAAVAADSTYCSQIGKEILEKNGSAVDAAIAALLCNNVANPHSMGIGGGHFMLIYDTPRNETEKVLDSLIAREMAPKNATYDMFEGDKMAARKGGRSIAVPGEVKGFWEAHQRFGRLPWRELFTGAITLCDGALVNRAVARAIRQKEADIRNSTTLRAVFVHPNNDSILKEGDTMKRPTLKKTLQTLADEGADAFYNGSLTKNITMDIQEQGGIIDEDDINRYYTVWRPALNISLDNGEYDLYGVTAPASGAILIYILNTLDGYKFNSSSIEGDDAKTLTYHRMMEAFKFAYARRSEMGDHENDPDLDLTQFLRNLTSKDYGRATMQEINDNRTYGIWHYRPDFIMPASPFGTSHLSVYGPDGSAVAVTSTINLYFGSKVMGSRTGIIFNDEMDDFSSPNVTNAFDLPPSPANFIKPGKRPLSSMSPVLVMDKNRKVILVIGAAGGTKITSITSYVSMHTLWFGQSICDSMDWPRLHHQLEPNEIRHEPHFPENILENLRQQKGHNTTRSSGLAVVEAIHNVCSACAGNCPAECIHAVTDIRKAGTPAGF